METLSDNTISPTLSSQIAHKITPAPFSGRSLARLRLERELYALYNSNKRRLHTIIGSVSAFGLLAGLLFLLNFLDITPHVRNNEQKSIPIQLLQFGELGSNEPNKGNLSTEGKALSAAEQANQLADAIKPERQTMIHPQKPPHQPSEAHTTEALAIKTREYTQPSIVKPVAEEQSGASQQHAQSSNTNTAATGAIQGSTADDAEGLGRFGSGQGRGQGYGLEWGGGGNRVVLHKELPKYPAGVNTTTQIKIRFTVLPNGTVGMILPMQKGDPLLERASMEALRRWQFNPLNDTKEMVGFITFTFRVQ